MESSDEEFEVERILAETTVDGAILYLVKWIGYPDEQCTWEPEANFNSDETITNWKAAKARGDELDEEFLRALKSRMIRFDPTSWRAYDQNKEVAVLDSPNSPPELSGHPNIQSTGYVPLQKPVMPSPAKFGNLFGQRLPTIQKNVLSKTALDKDNTTKSLFIPERDTRPNDTERAKSTNQKTGKVGQAFRSLSHQNNFRKRARTEAEPDYSKLKLITIADLDSRDTYDTAHILPAAKPGPINDRQHIQSDRDVHIEDRLPETRQPQDLSLTQSSRAREAVAAGDRVQKSSAEKNAPTKPTTPRPQLTVRKLSGDASWTGRTTLSTNSSNKTPRSRDDQSDGQGMIAVSPNRSKNTLQNSTMSQRFVFHGRHCNKGELVLTLKAGHFAGDVKLVDVAWRFCQPLLTLRQGSVFDLDFGSRRISRRRFDMLFYNSRPLYTTIGYVEAFEDTSKAINGCLNELESSDLCSMWHHPDPNVDISILLYSCKAQSWGDIGNLIPHSHCSKLHVAFLQKVSTSLLDSQTQNVLLPSNLKRNDQEPKRSTSITDTNIPFDAESLNDLVTPHESLVESPMDYSPSVVVQPSAPGVKDTNTDTVPVLTLDYKEFVNVNGIRGSTTTHPLSFIAYGNSNPFEADIICKWLKHHAGSDNVWTDIHSGSWNIFKQQARKLPSLILMYDGNPAYTSLEGLGILLGFGHVHCYNMIHRKRNGTVPAQISVTHTTLFPRGTVFLITEACILHELDNTLFNVDYFVKEKKSGWQIMFRPRIQSWLFNKACAEKDETTRKSLLQLLMRIEGLLPAVDTESIIDNHYQATEDEDLVGDLHDQNPEAYVVSPASIPGYNDGDAVDKDTIRKRDSILIDYFRGYTILMADKYRRFFVFTDQPAPNNSGHIRFQKAGEFRKTVGK